MVNLRVGEAYRANNELGWLMLPWVASYYWILNRFRLQNAAKNIALKP
jgi:hypothetical protein